MGERIAWITDSTCFLDDDLKNNKDVYVIPIVIIINEKEYLDGVTIQPNELYRRMRQEKVVPTTSQPSVGTFYQLYKKLEPDYDRIIAVHLSSKLSGTAVSAAQAAEMVNLPVHVLDTALISFPVTHLIKDIMKNLESGASVEEALNRAGQLKEKNKTFVLFGSLEQLHRSGRLSGTKYLLGSILNMKPIIALENGALEIKAKVRSEKKAGQFILQELYNACDAGIVTECMLLYGEDPGQTARWSEAISKARPEINVLTAPLGTAIGVHAGGHTLGLSWFTE
ncbi:DegV family protein [Peribacillus sp. SCS-155]|uniref:DegV family protein n=1 Tax=Peribacillus sedimenti TaxID=3115297 RepID=UPI003905861C